jgi:hypothetical protein
MKITSTAILAILLLAGCARKPSLDVSGKWYFYSGGQFTLVQADNNIYGAGYFNNGNQSPPTPNPEIPITAQGKIRGDNILLTFKSGTNTLADVEFLPTISPKGSQRYLKCPKYLGLSLIPQGVDAFTCEILKPEAIEQMKKLEGFQQSPTGDLEKK